MKIKITKTPLSTIIALLIMTISAYSQNFSGAKNMGALLNTTMTEQNPTLSPNGLSLYIASNRTGTLGGQDIWVSQRSTLGAAWGAPQHLGATLNSTVNDAVTGFSLDGKTMFLQSTRSDLGGLGGFDIYISTRTNPNDDFGWTAPVNLAAVNSALFDGGANYFEDPTTGAGTLIFGSNRVGDPAIDFHLYQSTRNTDGTFNAPTLMTDLSSPMGGGAEIRTAIRRDGLEIFIASSRPGGMAFGLFDIWVSKRDSVSAAWNPPTLVPGINTVEDDTNPSLSPDDSILVFQSTRTVGGFGLTDLYAATRCSIYATDTPCYVNRTESDFDGDGRTDISVFRPSEGTWYVMESNTNTFRVQQFGLNGDKIVPGDYDGDGRTDFAVFRPSDRHWYIQRSSDNSFSAFQWGLATDKLVPGDYDGDGKTDIAVFRDGIWYIIQSSDESISYRYFGLSGDIPVAAASMQ